MSMRIDILRSVTPLSGEKQKHLVRIDNLNDKWIELFEELNKRFPDDIPLVSKMHSNVSYLVPYDWLHLEINPFKENNIPKAVVDAMSITSVKKENSNDEF